jgi:ubiquinone biosynthesis protein COQ9
VKITAADAQRRSLDSKIRKDIQIIRYAMRNNDRAHDRSHYKKTLLIRTLLISTLLTLNNTGNTNLNELARRFQDQLVRYFEKLNIEVRD